MTKDEFEAEYARESGVTIEQLREWGRIAMPCNCEDDLCRGWQMIHGWSTEHVTEPSDVAS